MLFVNTKYNFEGIMLYDRCCAAGKYWIFFRCNFEVPSRQILKTKEAVGRQQGRLWVTVQRNGESGNHRIKA